MPSFQCQAGRAGARGCISFNLCFPALLEAGKVDWALLLRIKRCMEAPSNIFNHLMMFLQLLIMLLFFFPFLFLRLLLKFKDILNPPGCACC